MKLYLILINALSFLFMLLDKHFAKTHRRRIPEDALLLAALLGGSVGSLLGMYLFRHKTRKAKFRYGIPLILALQIAAYFLIR